MIHLLTFVHIAVCLLLIGLVLLQDPKGGGAGGIFGGGGSNSLFGATGATTFVTRVTRWSAIVFGITCLMMTILSKPHSGSVIDPSFVAPPAATAPAAPAEGAAPAAPPAAAAPAAPAPEKK